MNFISIVKKEILENIYNFRYVIIVALSVLVIGTSVFTMYQDYCLRVENYAILVPDAKEAVAIIPPTPLSIFVKGLDDNLTSAHEIDYSGITLGSNQQATNRLFRLFTTPDLLYVIKIVLSLCAMLMAYDIITREKESGTLRQIMANSVKRPIILLGKFTGGFVSFITPVLFVLLLMVTIVSLLPMVQFTPADYSKIAVFMLVSILYLAIFFVFGMLISCLTGKSVTALVISLFFWVSVVFVIPNVGNSISKQLVKTQSIERLEQQQNVGWIKSVFELINHHNKIDTNWEKLTMDYAVEQNKLRRVSQMVAKCSPAGVFTLLATNIMNTGIDDQDRLRVSVWEYYNQVKHFDTDSDGNLVGEFPVFQHQRNTLAASISGANSVSVLLLLTFIVIIFALAYAAFMKYDLR